MEKSINKGVYRALGLFSFQRRFPYEKSCCNYLVKCRWPDGFRCPVCGEKGDFLPSRKLFECRSCHRQTSATAGTIFHRSRLSLRKWFWAIFLISTSKKGVPASYLQRQLEIRSYRAAWLMSHKIRQAMIQRDALYQLQGTIQTDEIFIGGKQSHEERRQGSNKTPFLMLVGENENGGPSFLTFEELETIYEEHVLPALEKNVAIGSTLKSDGAGVYMRAREKGYKHDRVVTLTSPDKGYEHLKWVNLITSNLKRYLLSTHHGAHRKYRKHYLAEFAYRFNRRYWPTQAFDRLLYACVMADPVSLPELKS